jgi:hypothetical protein
VVDGHRGAVLLGEVVEGDHVVVPLSRRDATDARYDDAPPRRREVVA